MNAVRYRYFLIFFTKSGGTVDRSVELDEFIFRPAIEWAHLYGIRHNMLPPLTFPSGASIIPCWSETLGEPFIDGFDIQIPNEAATIVSIHFPLMYFQQHVACFIRQVTNSELGNMPVFSVCAVPDHDRGACDSAGSSFSLSIEEMQKPLDLRKKSFVSLLKAATFEYSAYLDTRGIDFPVFITEEVISEAIKITQDAGKNEAGGILAGYLCRGSDDSNSSEIFTVITFQIRAPVAKEDAGPTRIRFTPDTWSYFRDSLKRRNKGERVIAWWHSHPIVKQLCNDRNHCGGERSCNGSVFFSAADIRFHRIAFYSAYSTALVIGDTRCPGTNIGLFGWHEGIISRRNFYLLRKTAAELQDLVNPDYL